jgi:negative modulator of initiation of replication
MPECKFFLLPPKNYLTNSLNAFNLLEKSNEEVKIMKMIEIEDDVYKYLLQQTTQIGESASQILRRLLGIPGPQSKKTLPVERSNTELSECLAAPAFKAQPDVVGKFLYVLSCVHKRDPEQFKKVLAISGKRRKYFALSSKELRESGSSVFPKQVPNSPIWVITNNDTPKKKRMIRDVLQLVGYSDEAVKQAVEALA